MEVSVHGEVRNLVVIKAAIIWLDEYSQKLFILCILIKMLGW